jgi:hypothetical protein
MGQQIDIRVTREPEWAKVAAYLETQQEKAIVRMIDGLPAFPDEIPEPGWKELRISLSGGMVTLRRETDSVACVVWGNADAALLRSWRVCAWAVAKAGECPGIPNSPESLPV